MNIMFLAIFPIIPSVGGVQRVTDSLSKELQSRGHTVIYMTYSRKHMMRYGPFSAPQYYVEIQNRKSDEIKREVEQIIQKHSIQIVINQNFNNYIFLNFLPKYLKIISVCHIQPYLNDSISHNKKANAITTVNFKSRIIKLMYNICPALLSKIQNREEDKIIRQTFEASNKVCFISELFFPRVLKHLPDLPKEKFAAINNPNSFPLSHSDWAQKENLVLWVGRIENNSKNTIDFIYMWEQFSLIHRDWKAVIIGEGSDLQFDIDYVNSHNIENISFTGRINNVIDYYKRAKYAIITSWSESWCLVITEAMVNSCIPIVYDTFETVHEIIDNGVNGFICEPTTQALNHQLEQCVNMSDKQSSDISIASEKKSQQFSVEKITDQWIDLLMEIIND